MINSSGSSQLYPEDWDDIPSQPSAPKDSVAAPRPLSERGKSLDAVLKEIPSVTDKDAAVSLTPIANWSRPDFFPSLTARSSLFCASRIGAYNTDESKLETVQLKCQGASLTYTGPKLDMHDKLVWETAVQIAKDRKAPVGTTFVISLRDFASRMGWKDPSGSNLKWIWESIKRLTRAHLEYKAHPNDRDQPPIEGVGNLIAGAQRRGDSYAIQICEHFSKFAFELDKQFMIQIKRRETLKNLLAKWLHDFLSTHSKEHEFDLAYLREISGFTGRKKDFPAKAKQALEELKERIPALVANYEIIEAGKSSDDWKVIIHRGDEKPQFIVPRPAPSRVESSRGKTSPKRRSGVAL